MEAEEKERIVNGYSQKLTNSGYRWDQVRKICLDGIRGYERKKKRCAEPQKTA